MESWVDAFVRADWAPHLAFAMARLAGLFLAAPFFRSRLLPWRLKIGWIGAIGACVALSRASGGESASSILPADGIAAVLTLGGELIVGVALGWSLLLVLAAVESAAQWITQQIGLAAAAVADPVGGVEPGSGGELAFFHHAFAIVILLALDLHHSALRALAASFDTVPPGTLSASDLPELFLRLSLEIGPDIFVATVALALPVVLGLFVVSIVQGLLGRLVPEAELFTLGLPARLAAGLVLIASTLPATARWTGELLRAALRAGERLFV